ncbi:MAG: hypothetical protein LUQ04_01705 [Methanoregula sp.]|nr:hypothetical protein [Methanoregula sp.]
MTADQNPVMSFSIRYPHEKIKGPDYQYPDCTAFNEGQRQDENNYTLKKGKKCNEKSFSCDAHPNTGLSFQMQLLLEF